MSGAFVPSRTIRCAWRMIAMCMLILAYSTLSSTYAAAQVVATYDFEDGTAQGWGPFFNGTAANSTAKAFAGTHSLLVNTSSIGTGGADITETSLLLPGATYTITGWVQLASKASSNANFQMIRNDPTCSGGTCFDLVGPFMVAVTDTGWAQIGGTYIVPQTATGLTLFTQLLNETTPQSFYLDDVVITETAPPPTGNPIATYTFADGGLDGWAPFGPVSLSNSTSAPPDPKGNTHSLLTSNRTATFMGPSLDLLGVNGVVAGATYHVSAYVLLAAPDSSNPTVTMSTKRTDCSTSSGVFANLGTSAALSSTTWTQVQGTLSFSDLPGPPSSLTLYFQSSSATDSFYISDVFIGETLPPPLPVSQQDNTGISTNFEDAGVDGWASHFGATVANTAEAHTGTHSLLVNGRTGNFQGAQISISNKMYVGSQYSISIWVLIANNDGTALTDGSMHTINMSLETTFQGNQSFPGVNGFPGTTIPADGNWHQILVPNYTMASPYDPGAAFLFLQTFPASGNDLASFDIDDFQLTFLPPPTIQADIPSIFTRLEDFFPVGAEIDTSDLSGPHADLLTKHFNSIVSGNDMKWSSVENTKGSFNFGNADREVGLAVCHDMKVRGHNLVWANGSQTPAYAFGDGTNSPANQATVTANIQEHIQNEVTHFGDKVYIWDVVNEPIDANQPDCLVHGPFYNVLGKSYIDIALEAARQYTPSGTKLFINDFSTADPARLACLVKIVQDLQSRGIPLDGVGHEMHNNINYPPVPAMETAIKTLAKLDIDQQVTELDLSVYNAGDNTSNYGAGGGTVPASIIAQQGYLYWHYFQMFRRMHRHLSGVTFWGLADDNTWLSSFPINRLNLPLPFDTGLQAKPAYFGVINDPDQLPGFGLNFHITSKTGPKKARVWTITAANPGPGTAYTVQINGFTLQQVRGGNHKNAPCSPVIKSPAAFPVALGDIAQGASASTTVTLDFSACHGDDTFSLQMPWSQANGADTGELDRDSIDE